MPENFTKIPNAWIEAVMLLPLRSGTWQVLWAIIRQTWGWQRHRVMISQRAITRSCNLHRRTVRRCLEELSAYNVVTVNTCGTGQATEVILHTEYQRFKKKVVQPVGAHMRQQAGAEDNDACVNTEDIGPSGTPAAPTDKGDRSAPTPVPDLRPVVGAHMRQSLGAHTRPPHLVKENTTKKKESFLKKAQSRLPRLDVALFEKFLDYRAQIGKPITQETIDSVLDQIIWATDGYPQVAYKVLNICMANGWAMVTNKIEPPTVEEKYPEYFDDSTRI